MGVIHPEAHPLAGQTVKLRDGTRGPWAEDAGGADYRVEDWADRVWGQSWGVMEGNPTALVYAVRAAVAGLGTDDDVLYGHVDGFAFLAHATELVTEVV